MWVGCIFHVQLFFLLLRVYLADILDQNGSTNDANHTKRVGASITIGNTWRTIREYAEQRFIGSTKTWGIGYSTIERTYHHRKVVGITCVKEQVVACKHYAYVEENGSCREQVEGDTTFLETLEETRAYLKTNHEDKENQSEVLHESQDVLGCCESHMTCENTSEENEGYA